MQCVNRTCGQDSDGDWLYCRNCLHLLHVDDTDGPQPASDWKLLRLAEACELLQTGNLEPHEFRAWLNQFASAHDDGEAQISNLYRDIPGYLRDDFQEEFDAGLFGVARCRSSVQRLAALDEEAPSRSTIVDALADYYRGVCDILEAMDINRRNRNRPLWA